MPQVERAAGCAVCRHLDGTAGWPLVTRNRHGAVLVPSRQPTPGTVLVVHRRHVVAPDEVDDDEADDVWLLVRRVVAAVLAWRGSATYHVSQYTGDITGEPLDHLWWRVESRDDVPPSSAHDIRTLPVIPVALRERQATELRSYLCS